MFMLINPLKKPRTLFFSLLKTKERKKKKGGGEGRGKGGKKRKRKNLSLLSSPKPCIYFVSFQVSIFPRKHPIPILIPIYPHLSPSIPIPNNFQKPDTQILQSHNPQSHISSIKTPPQPLPMKKKKSLQKSSHYRVRNPEGMVLLSLTLALAPWFGELGRAERKRRERK